MNSVELDTMAERFGRFTATGMTKATAETLADKLTQRDREDDQRHSCAECRHGRARRCADGAPLPAEILHHCDHFDALL